MKLKCGKAGIRAYECIDYRSMTKTHVANMATIITATFYGHWPFLQRYMQRSVSPRIKRVCRSGWPPWSVWSTLVYDFNPAMLVKCIIWRTMNKGSVWLAKAFKKTNWYDPLGLCLVTKMCLYLKKIIFSHYIFTSLHVPCVTCIPNFTRVFMSLKLFTLSFSIGGNKSIIYICLEQ